MYVYKMYIKKKGEKKDDLMNSLFWHERTLKYIVGMCLCCTVTSEFAYSSGTTGGPFSPTSATG